MGGEFQSGAALFDLDALDQDSVEAASAAQEAEIVRVQLLPDHADAMVRYPLVIQEFDTSDAPLEVKAVDFLRSQAINVAIQLQSDPAEVSEESVGFAARFFGTPEADHEAIVTVFDRYHDYALALSWAVTYNRTIAQAREEIAATRPHFHVDYGLTEREPDPFRGLFGINFKVEGDDDWEE